VKKNQKNVHKYIKLAPCQQSLYCDKQSFVQGVGILRCHNYWFNNQLLGVSSCNESYRLPNQN